ncbi:TetR-like C-terminal domain-containing protein [Pseudogracilibacillus sp. SE30717A]|uniref:TetR/AcrR family transcriptional regulator n=1 Tax=Pseudogracilibacillus sp. SE30717A TaxID=3098293 RepID=UPI00300E48C2
MVLKDSLMKLLKEKQISAITVKEICEFADINRSTFYSHYTDQFDLLQQIEEELIEDMSMYLSSFNFDKKDNTLEKTVKLIEYFASKQEECQTLLNENSDSSFEKKVSQVARRFMIKNWMEIKPVDHENSEYLSAFIVSGSIQVMKVWLNNGMDKSPQEIAEIITTIINKGIFG